MSKPRILIVEDERIVAEDIKRALEGYGYTISSIVASGEETLKRARKDKPDLVLMDIVLKGEMDGIEAARRIYEHLDIPVVYLTAHADEAILKRTAITEPFGYILKPFEDRELNASIEMALSKYDMERRSKEGAKFVSSLLNNAPNPILVINPDTSVRHVNPALESLTGFSSDEIVGKKPPYPWWTEETLEKTSKDLKQIFHEEAQKLEEHFQKKNEEKFWVEITSTPVKENGKLKYRLSNWVDITERKQAEEALKKSEAKYRELVQNANSIILRRTPQGIITFFNEFAQSFFGFTEDEIVGKNIVGTIVPKTDSTGKDLTAMIREIGIHPEQYAINENQNMRHDGELVYVAWTNKALRDKDGNIVEILCVGTDITERNRLQSQLMYSQKMEAIGTMAGGIAHDFNNILSIIIGYAQLARDGTPKGSQLWVDLGEVFEAAKRARDLVKQILAFSKPSEQERKPVKLHLMVTETLKFLRSSLPATIEVREHLTTTGRVFADPVQIEQVLMNLFTNAYQSMSEHGGVLEVRLEEVVLEREAYARYLGLAPGPYLALIVRDTGSGIHSSVIDRIFEPYFTTKPAGEGTGMGLAVVHGIVKSHGAGITVDSEVGKGTTFKVLFPRYEDAEAVGKSEERGALSITEGTERILFVEDELAILNMGMRLLESIGYKVVTSINGIKALEIFRAQPADFDLIITDMTMPNMTGAELATELLSIRPGIPIILCTGFSERITGEKAERMGIRKFVMKPLLPGKLVEVVREVLHG
jgi:two-component system cell cycle sensor histidine kinase/response regulator CckA